MLVVKKIYSNQAPSLHSSASSSSPHLVKPHQICQLAAQQTGGLGSHFLSHSLFTCSHLQSFPPLSLCVSYTLSHTFPLIFSRLSQMLFSCLSQTHSTFFSFLFFSPTLILFFHHYPPAPCSLWCRLFLSASPSPSPLLLQLSPSLFIRLHLLLLPAACYISPPPPPPRCPVAASVGGMPKSASWMKSNMTGSTTVAGSQMYFLEFTSRRHPLVSFDIGLKVRRFYSL